MRHESASFLQGRPPEHKLDSQLIADAELSLEIVQDAGLTSHLPLTLSAHAEVSPELLNDSCLASELKVVVAASLELGSESVDVIRVLLQLS